LDMRALPVDLLTISAHKFHGPKGVGALYVRRGMTFPPFIIGGHQERNRRAGTENVAGIIGMGKAAEIALAHLADDSERIGKLRDRFEESLLRSCPETRVNGKQQSRLPNTSNCGPWGWRPSGFRGRFASAWAGSIRKKRSML
ncbi:MAG: aminotransferase class V-fold PLP-dependent enzyme, partial [Deltaproteobacteria bacterium]|nr:aminotransferase class V-fold PLP-dependent enzyme [Deltaproteobacteria bacterium]